MTSTVDAKLLKATKFPPEFSQKVDMQKVNLEVMKKWIAGKISKILGNEDDVVVELCFNLLEGSRFPDIKRLQIQLTGFLDKDTPAFCKELWNLCVSAQSNAQGVPKELLEAKKLELIQEKLATEKAADEARRKREEGERRDREMQEIRNRERKDRAQGAPRGDSWRGTRGRNRDFERGNRDGRGGRGYDRRGSRSSRSPPPRRRRSPDRYIGPPLSFDSYVPSHRGRGGRDRGRDRSPFDSLSPSRSPSRSISRSPPPRRRARSRTRSPPRRRRSRTRSISRSPERNYRGQGGRGRVISPPRRGRRRSYTPSSRSSSPRRRKTRRATSESISRSPAPRSRRAITRSRSPTPVRKSGSPERRGSKRSAIPEHETHSNVTTADPRKRAPRRTTPNRLSRSRSRTPPRRNRRSRSRSRNRDRKRRRSMQRYEPSNKRRRNSSSMSPAPPPPVNACHRKSPDDAEREAKRPASPAPASAAEETKGTAAVPDEVTPKPAMLQASELREKLLKEKIMSMRRQAPAVGGGGGGGGGGVGGSAD